jgi:hypothetical protein
VRSDDPAGPLPSLQGAVAHAARFTRNPVALGAGMTITATVLWRVGPGPLPVKTAHALLYGSRRTACGLKAGAILYNPTFQDECCRKCNCAIGEHAWVGEDPEHCQDCGETR